MRTARALVARIGEAAGVEHAHPHRFRYTVGRRFALAGAPLTVTARYYENMDDEDVRRFTRSLGFN